MASLKEAGAVDPSVSPAALLGREVNRLVAKVEDLAVELRQARADERRARAALARQVAIEAPKAP